MSEARFLRPLAKLNWPASGTIMTPNARACYNLMQDKILRSDASSGILI